MPEHISAGEYIDGMPSENLDNLTADEVPEMAE